MKKIYSTPELKVVDINAEYLMLDASGTPADPEGGMESAKRESNDGLFDW